MVVYARIRELQGIENRMKFSLTLLIAVLLAIAALASCGGNNPGSRLPSARGNAPVLGDLTYSEGKGVSGLPTGVIVTWPRVSDPITVGYYLYRDTQSITAPNPSLRTNNGNLIPQSGDNPIVFYDNFSPAIGQTYYYRLSVVDINGEESELSNELSITIQPHEISGLNPLSGYYGDTLTIIGDNFGIYNPPLDFVYFMTDGMERLEAVIVDWQDGAIECIVPEDAITAPVQVQVSGTVSESDTDFVILNPFLYSVSPTFAMSGDDITLAGDNLGDAPGAGDGVTMPGGIFIPYNDPGIVSWADGEIVLTVPSVIAAQGNITATVGGETTNGVFFSVRPSITDCVPRRFAPGSLNSVTLTGLNFGNGSNCALQIVDLDNTSPAEAVTIPVGHIVSWNNNRIVFRAPIAAYGDLPALVVKRGIYESDPYQVVLLAPLASEFLFPVPGTTITQPTIFAVKSVTDMDKVEFFINEVGVPIYVDEAGPAFDITLDPATMFNGTYTLIAKAYRGLDTALGSIVFDVLSLPGDTNGDGVIDDLDVIKLRENFGVQDGNALYHRYLDPNLDGAINEADVAYIGYYFGGALVI